ncbi:MAG: OFA family MFS transporter [Acidobacteria bacterium]|nr:OFA family MFS transporter [Acidobacteriota bacterium]
MDGNLNRSRYAAASLVMQLCLGVVYSWSVFRGPLSQAYGWSRVETIAPYRWSLLAFTAGMIVAGLWQDSKGPRLVATIGGILLGAGCLLAGLIGNTVQGLIVSYGVVAGFGVGFAYVTPIATCIKWFPDKRGFIVGLSVMGFGVGSLIFGPLLELLIGKDPARLAETLPRTFFILSAVFFVLVVGAAQFYRVPPAGWRPVGWNPAAAKVGGAARDFTPAEMLRTPQFYVLWLIYFLGTSVGLTAIGEATPIVQEMAKTGAAMSGGAALGVMSVFNGAGRLIWGSASDRFGRSKVVIGMCGASILACTVLLRNASSFGQLLAGLCLAGFAYGGYLALMPSFTADFFGSRHVGANYGILFSAWGLCGFIVPGYFAGVIDAAKKAGNAAAGYSEVYLGLAGLAALGAGMVLLARRPGSA